MKNKIIICSVFLTTIFSQAILAQSKKDSCCISKANLIGTWQRNDSIVGSGLNQNFQFYDNGTFVLNLGSNGDDLRDIIQLKGKYRVDKNLMFFTITSKTIVEGHIGISEMATDLNLFSVEDGKEKEIPESNPKEIADPSYIKYFSKTHIKLNNETYYKVK